MWAVAVFETEWGRVVGIGEVGAEMDGEVLEVFGSEFKADDACEKHARRLGLPTMAEAPYLSVDGKGQEPQSATPSWAKHKAPKRAGPER